MQNQWTNLLPLLLVFGLSAASWLIGWINRQRALKRQRDAERRVFEESLRTGRTEPEPVRRTVDPIADLAARRQAQLRDLRQQQRTGGGPSVLAGGTGGGSGGGLTIPQSLPRAGAPGTSQTGTPPFPPRQSRGPVIIVAPSPTGRAPAMPGPARGPGVPGPGQGAPRPPVPLGPNNRGPVVVRRPPAPERGPVPRPQRGVPSGPEPERPAPVRAPEPPARSTRSRIEDQPRDAFDAPLHVPGVLRDLLSIDESARVDPRRLGKMLVIADILGKPVSMRDDAVL